MNYIIMAYKNKCLIKPSVQLFKEEEKDSNSRGVPLESLERHDIFTFIQGDFLK